MKSIPDESLKKERKVINKKQKKINGSIQPQEIYNWHF